MISTAIKRAFAKAKARDWLQLHMAVDIHDTMIPGNYNKDEIPTDFYPDVVSTLKFIQARGDINLIIYSCSHDSELAKYKILFESEGLYFSYYNENPDVVTKAHGLGNYDKKMYFDILLEDKAGFEPLTDWKEVRATLSEIDIL